MGFERQTSAIALPAEPSALLLSSKTKKMMTSPEWHPRFELWVNLKLGIFTIRAQNIQDSLKKD